MRQNRRYPSTPERFLYAFVALVSICCCLPGCKKVDKPNVTDWAQICVRAPDPKFPKTLVRASDASCVTTNPEFRWLFIDQRHSGFIDVVRVGQNLPGVNDPADSYVSTFDRPQGVVIGLVPENGGLGRATP